MMAQKNETARKELRAAIKRNGLSPAWWIVLQDLIHYMIIRHRTTGDVKVIEK